MGARRVTGFDRAIMHTVVILPMAVAGIVVMVKNSVALAFSLAGVVVSQFSQRHGGRSLRLSRHRCRTGCGHRRARRGSRHLGCAQLLTLWKSDFGGCPNGGPKNGWSARAADVHEKKKEGKREKKK